MCEKHEGKGRDLYAAFVDFEKVYYQTDRNVVCQAIQVYEMAWKLLREDKSFYIKASKACVSVQVEKRNISSKGCNTTEMCYAAMIV